MLGERSAVYGAWVPDAKRVNDLSAVTMFCYACVVLFFNYHDIRTACLYLRGALRNHSQTENVGSGQKRRTACLLNSAGGAAGGNDFSSHAKQPCPHS